MKKKIKYLLIIFLLLLNFVQVKAVQLNQSDYEEYNIRRVYVVGDYIFDLSKHNPTLKDLMLAAQSSPVGDVSIIEIKIAENLDGELTRDYRELLNAKTLTQFPKLDVKYIYMSEIMPETPTNENKIVLENNKYGDVNEDGVVDGKDVLRLGKHLLPENAEILTGQALKNADINNDGKVDAVDSILLNRYNAELYPNTLPDSPIINYILYGDANEDGVVDTRDSLRIAKHLSPDFDTTLTEQGLKNADVNVDGKINSTDSTLISLYVSGSYNVDLPNYPITDYAMYGDANEDGIIDLIDALAVMEYLSSNSGLTKQGIKNADVNADGKVNNVDSLLIMQYSSGWYDDANLPLAPLNNYQMYGDVNEDGTVDNFDTIELLKYLSGTQTLTKQAFKNADVNDDGIVNNVDNVLISRYTVGWYEDTLAGEPIIDYVLYADVNNDGYVDGKDTIRIGKYLQSSVELNAQEKKNADVNADGVINQTDADLINKYLLTVDDGEIPSEPLS